MYWLELVYGILYLLHTTCKVLNPSLQLTALMMGMIQQDIQVTLWVGLGGAALTFLMVVPPWPAFNESPETWLPAGSAISGSGIEVDGMKIN